MKSQITTRQEKHNSMARKMKGFAFLRKYCTNVTAGEFSMPRFLLSKGFDYILERVDSHNCSEWLNASKVCQNRLVFHSTQLETLFASFYPSGSDHKKYENNMLSCNTLATKLVQE